MKETLKRLVVAFGCIVLSTTMMAQSKSLYLSSVSGTNVSNYDGQTRNVTLYRSIYNGWNTFCVPFSMTVAELETAFGKDCKLEKLSNVRSNGDVIDLYFTDVKSEGVKANTPYLLHYTGETKSIKVSAEDTKIEYANDPAMSFSSGMATVKFAGAPVHIEANGQYGIYVKDNAEASFSLVESSTSGFYATRCYITINGINNPTLIAHHGKTEVTDISEVNNVESVNDEVFNLNGVRLNGLQKGMNVVKGKKLIVK